MHGPDHTFCCGIEKDGDPLGCAAWAGYYAAKGMRGESLTWVENAKALHGQSICNTYSRGNARIQVRLIGGELDEQMCNDIIEQMTLYRDRFRRDAAKDKGTQDKVPEPETIET